MKKFAKRLFIIGSIFLLATLGIAAVLTAIFEDQIGQKLITEVNKQLETELSIDKFDLGIITTFPNVSANMRGIELRGSDEGTLLEASNLSFRFGLLSLLGSKIKIKSVVLSDAMANVIIDRKGQANYNIFKTTEKEGAKEEGSGGPTISLKTARLKNVNIRYADARSKNDISARIEDANFSGEFSSKQFSLTSDADLFSKAIQIDGKPYLVKRNLGYDAKIKVDLEAKKYEIESFELDVEKNLFSVDGVVESWDDGSTYLDLFFSSKKSNLGSILKSLPKEYLKSLQDFDSNGNFVFEASIKGKTTATQSPEVKVELTMNNGKITSPRLDGALKDVSFFATYTNGRYKKNSSSSFEVRDFKGYFNRELFELNLQVDNFDDPDIDFIMDGVIPLNVAYGLFNNPKITKGSGEIEFKNIQLKGRYKDMISTSRIARVTAGGQLEFDDASLTINDEKLTLDRGTLTLENNTLSIDGLKLEGAGTELQFNGAAFNTIPVLFKDSLNTQKAELEFQADLQSDKLDIDRLLHYFAISEAETQAPEPVVDSIKTVNIQKRELATHLFKGTFNAVIKDFNYNLIEGKDFIGKFEIDNGELLIDGKTTAMGGDFDLDGRVFFEEEPYLKAKVACQAIDVKEFFRQAENFGQDVLTFKHVEGTLEAKILINAYWDQGGNFQQEKLRVLTGFGITDGELANFEMLEQFATFVKIKDLRRIKFTNMENFLEIRKQRLYIPAMFIRSNALNITVNGEHSFDNEIKYNLKVNAGQVLANRFKRHDDDLRPVKAGKKGFFNLHYQILGSIEQYNFKSAKKQVKSDFELSEHRKREVKDALEKEFGPIYLVQEPEDWRDIPEYDSGNDDEDTEYLDWGAEEEDDPANSNNKEEAIKVNEKPGSQPGKPSTVKPVNNKPESDEEDDTEYLDWEIEKDTSGIRRRGQ